MSRSRILVLIACALAGPSLARGADAHQGPVVRFERPATNWSDAFPVGSEHLGALVHGSVPVEHIRVFEVEPRLGAGRDTERRARVRALARADRGAEATSLAQNLFLGTSVTSPPSGRIEVRLEFPGHEHADDYFRELDLATAVQRTVYRVDEVSYRREVFASATDRVVAIRIEADHRGTISFTLQAHGRDTNATTRIVQPHTWVITTPGEDPRSAMEAHVRLLHTGGRIRTEEDAIRLEDADEATVLVAVARASGGGNADSTSRAGTDVAGAARRTYVELRSDHLRSMTGLLENR